MSEPFYHSEVVRQELHDMQSLYKDLYDISIRFPLMTQQEKRDHLEKTMELVAKQKVFYARLSLMSLEDKEAADLKIRIDQMTAHSTVVVKASTMSWKICPSASSPGEKSLTVLNNPVTLIG